MNVSEALDKYMDYQRLNSGKKCGQEQLAVPQEIR